MLTVDGIKDCPWSRRDPLWSYRGFRTPYSKTFINPTRARHKIRDPFRKNVYTPLHWLLFIYVYISSRPISSQSRCFPCLQWRVTGAIILALCAGKGVHLEWEWSFNLFALISAQLHAVGNSFLPYKTFSFSCRTLCTCSRCGKSGWTCIEALSCSMVLALDGNSKIRAHLCRDLVFLIC